VTRTERLSRARLQDVALWRGLQTELGLSDRQIQVAILLVMGLTIRQIAERLGVSRHTANTHYERLRARLGDLGPNAGKAVVIVTLLHRSGLLL